MVAAVKYATISLPQKPRLAPWVTLVALGDNRLQLRGAEFTYTLNHELFIEALEVVRPLLNGEHDVEEIASSGGQIYLPTTITFLLKMLRANGLLQEGNVAPPAPLKSEDLKKHDNLIQFLSHYVSNPIGALALLKGAKVAVLGSPSLRISIENSLYDNGIDLSPDIQTALDKTSNKNGSSLAGLINNLDFLIVCQETADPRYFETINSICLENGVRWIRASVEGTKAYLGPTVIPHQSACYVCYQRRIDSNMPDLETHLAYRKQLASSDTITSSEGLFPALTSIIAGQVVLEVVRSITGFAPPKTIGRFYEFDATSPTIIGHEVLRLPRCPVCISQNPKMEAWDDTIFLSKKVS